MKRLVVALSMLPLFANAQTAPSSPSPPSPAAIQSALGGELSEVLAQSVQWRARALADEQQITELQAQLADARKKTGDSAKKP